MFKRILILLLFFVLIPITSRNNISSLSLPTEDKIIANLNALFLHLII